ncbi:MAG: carbonate dehydratase [Robiginitomaculum sp.]|nr:MAG: carbonate dehydratase [Robiginitomaculum sp.]
MTDPKWKKSLISGYQSFRAGAYTKQKDLYEELGTQGQSPDVLVIACVDSRVSPSTIFGAHPGEIFVLRNVANIVPPYDPRAGYHGTSAAIEFAVSNMKVSAIMVMGHESCGGVNAFLSSLDEEPAKDGEHSFLGSWIQILDAAHKRFMASNTPQADQQKLMEYAGVRQSMLNLMSFPFVEKAVLAGDLSLQGAYFSIIEGRLLFANEDGVFAEVPSE